MKQRWLVAFQYRDGSEGISSFESREAAEKSARRALQCSRWGSRGAAERVVSVWVCEVLWCEFPRIGVRIERESEHRAGGA